MKCPSCKKRMRCLDTRWQNGEAMTIRRWACACGMRGKTKETWLSTPTAEPKPKPQKKPDLKRLSVDKAANRLMDAFYGKPTKPKKEKDVSVKHTPPKSLFTDMDEGGSDEDFSDLGLDIPRGGDW